MTARDRQLILLGVGACFVVGGRRLMGVELAKLGIPHLAAAVIIALALRA